MDSLTIKLSSTKTLIEEKKTIKGYIKDWEETLNEIEHELKEREKRLHLLLKTQKDG